MESNVGECLGLVGKGGNVEKLRGFVENGSKSEEWWKTIWNGKELWGMLENGLCVHLHVLVFKF